MYEFGTSDFDRWNKKTGHYPVVDFSVQENTFPRKKITEEEWATIAGQTEPFILDLAKTGVTDEDIKNLLSQPLLRGIVLRDCDCVSDKSLDYLGQMTQLEVLWLTTCDAYPWYDRSKLIELLNLSRLQVMQIDSEFLKLKDFAKPGQFPDLQYLGIYGDTDGLPTDCICRLSVFQSLRSLVFIGLPEITLTELKKLAEFPLLEGLHLPLCILDDASMAILGSMRQLKDLTFTTSWPLRAMSDKGFSQLRFLTQLESLYVCANRKITDPVSPLVNLSHLRSFRLESHKVTRADLALLARMTQLEELSIELSNAGKSPVIDSDLCNLAELASLRHLELTYCSTITDDGLGFLLRLTQLQNLTLSNIRRISDDGLASATRGLELQSLNLNFGKLLTGKTLDYLEGMTSLKKLTIHACRKLDKKSVNRFRTARPDCDICRTGADLFFQFLALAFLVLVGGGVLHTLFWWIVFVIRKFFT